MELVLTEQDLEPLLERKVLEDYIKPEGILNSNYKKLVKESLNSPTSASLFSIKQRLKSNQYKFTSSIETVLKVSTFATIIVAIFY